MFRSLMAIGTGQVKDNSEEFSGSMKKNTARSLSGFVGRPQNPNPHLTSVQYMNLVQSMDLIHEFILGR